MSIQFNAKRALTTISTNIPHITAPASRLSTPSSSPKAALRYARAAWQRAFDAYMDGDPTGDAFAEVCAEHHGGRAYCRAMPILATREGIRDFLACVAEGVLIDAIVPEKAGHLLYAAQVAQAVLNSSEQPPRPRPK